MQRLSSFEMQPGICDIRGRACAKARSNSAPVPGRTFRMATSRIIWVIVTPNKGVQSHRPRSEATRTASAGTSAQASRHKARWPLCMLWQGIGDVMPQRLGTDKNVLPRGSPWFTVDASEHHFTNGASMCASQWRSAVAAKASCPSRRGLVVLDGLLACHPPELLWFDDSPRCESGAVRFSAHRTMTVTDELQ